VYDVSFVGTDTACGLGKERTMDDKLKALVAAALDRGSMTADEIKEQRVSFAYGNAPEESKSTMETMRIAAEYFDRIAKEEEQ
jgi:hypothetical protein